MPATAGDQWLITWDDDEFGLRSLSRLPQAPHAWST